MTSEALPVAVAVDEEDKSLEVSQSEAEVEKDETTTTIDSQQHEEGEEEAAQVQVEQRRDELQKVENGGGGSAFATVYSRRVGDVEGNLAGDAKEEDPSGGHDADAVADPMPVPEPVPLLPLEDTPTSTGDPVSNPVTQGEEKHMHFPSPAYPAPPSPLLEPQPTELEALLQLPHLPPPIPFPYSQFNSQGETSADPVQSETASSSVPVLQFPTKTEPEDPPPDHDNVDDDDADEPQLSIVLPPKESKENSNGSPGKSPSKDLSRRVFQCSSCNTYYEDWNLFLHMRNVHNRFICLLCLGLFPNAKRLARHLISRHSQSEKHFPTTTELLAWHENRPCHMMCVACETVEECRVDRPSAEHQCNAGTSTAAAAVAACKTCGAVGTHLCTGVGGGGGAPGKSSSKANKKRHRKETNNNNTNNNNQSVLSSNLVGGVKLKIKGLMGGSQSVQAVSEVVEGEAPGDNNGGAVERDNAEEVDMDVEEDEESPVKTKEAGKFSFNFILSKNGLVRNPNPSKRNKSETGGELSEEHRHSEEEEEQTQSDGLARPNEGQSEGVAVDYDNLLISTEIKKEEDGGGVPPLLVSKLKLKIPKYIVPVESSEEEEEEDEDYDEEDDDDDEEDDQEEGEYFLDNNEENKNEVGGESKEALETVKQEQLEENGEGSRRRSLNLPDGTDAAADGVAGERRDSSTVKEEREGGGVTAGTLNFDDPGRDQDDGGGVSVIKREGDEEGKASDQVGEFGGTAKEESDTKFRNNNSPLDDDPPDDEEKEILPTIDADGLLIADSSCQSFELSLNQPLDHIPVKDFLRTCMRATIPFCLYCYHARRIAVNAKQLAIHMIGSHRFTALVDSITAEELMPGTIVARLKSCLEELSEIYFNLDDYDSEVKAPLKMKAKIFECFQCRFTTGTHKELYLHNRKLHLKTVLLCLMCRSTFYNYSELLCHICPGVASRDLNYDLEFRCYYCNVNDLPSAFRLMVHLRKAHAVCEVCLEECFDQTRLSNHAWKHKLHHFCYRCGIAYRNKQDITRHLFWKHGTESELCKKCLQKRWPHIYHFCLPPMQFNCDQCVLTFQRAVHLRVHKRLHTEESPHVCAEEACEEKFISRRMLEKHERGHRGLPPEEGKQQQQQGETGANAAEEGNANGLNVEKEEIIGEEALSVPVDPYKDMPVPNLSESDSSDDDDEGEGEAKRSSLFDGLKMSRLSDSSDSEEGEEEEEKRKKTEKSTDVESSQDQLQVNSTNSRDENSTNSDSVPAPQTLTGDASMDSTSNCTAIKSEDGHSRGAKSEVDGESTKPPPVAEKACEDPDSDGERTKTKAIIDIWENFRSYQATQIQQQRRHSDEEEEDLIAPLPPPILHVLQSDHDYALMYKVFGRGDDDQDLQEIQDIEMMRRCGFKRTKACSCGPNCSCSSSSSSSASSTTSGASSSSSSSSEEEDVSKMTKKQRQVRAQRKAERSARKLEKAAGKAGGGDAGGDGNLLLSINDEVVTRLPETDLETDESETDEEFYDANPYKIAQQRLAEKNKLDEEEAEEKKSRRERRRRHRHAKRQAKLRELEEKTGAALESRLEAAAAAACSESSRSQALIQKLTGGSSAAGSRATTPQNVVPPLRLNFAAARFKKEVKAEQVNGGGGGGGGGMTGKQRSRTNSPVVVMEQLRLQQQQHSFSSSMGEFPGGVPSLVHHHHHHNANDEDSSSSSSNVKRSKRRRIPNRFYGYSSDDESMAGQQHQQQQQPGGLGLGTGGAIGPGGALVFRPTPPPNLTWNKEDLPGNSMQFTTHQNQSAAMHSRGDEKTVKLNLTKSSRVGDELLGHHYHHHHHHHQGGGGKRRRERESFEGGGGSNDGQSLKVLKRDEGRGVGAAGGGGGVSNAIKMMMVAQQQQRQTKNNNRTLVNVMKSNLSWKKEEVGYDDDDGEEEDDDDDYNDDDDDEEEEETEELITSGRTPKNSFSGVFAAGHPQQRRQQQQQPQPRQQEEEVVAAKHGHHPQLAAQLQSAVRYVPEPLPRLKIRTNGVTPRATEAVQAELEQQQQQQSTDLYCYCRRPYVGEMIGCDGEGCRIEWFHFECVGILMAPQGKWFCPDCSQKRRGSVGGGVAGNAMLGNRLAQGGGGGAAAAAQRQGKFSMAMDRV